MAVLLKFVLKFVPERDVDIGGCCGHTFDAGAFAVNPSQTSLFSHHAMAAATVMFARWMSPPFTMDPAAHDLASGV